LRERHPDSWIQNGHPAPSAIGFTGMCVIAGRIIGGDGDGDWRAGSRSADMSAGQDSREDTARESGSESDSESDSDERGRARHGAPRVARVAGARFANATGAVSRNATPAQRSAESVERDARRARAAAAEAAAARAAAAAVQPTSPQGEVSPTLRLLLREKPPLRQTLTPPPPETNPSQAESPDSRDGTAEAKERLIRAVTAILNPLVNPPPLQEQCVVTLHTLCKNVIDNPTDDRYRRVKANSRTMTQKVLACRGGEEFLNAAGWRKVALDYEGYYRCEDTARCAATLRQAEDVLRKNLQLCREKTERHERAKTKEKDDAARQKEEARRAIEEDKARRREAEERKRAAKAAAS
jgi:hypothetical protein